MTEHPRVHIGHFRQVTVWAQYYLERPEVEGVPLAAEPVAVVVWMTSSDDCVCGRCWPASEAVCPELARTARGQMRQARELHADRVIHTDRFTMAGFLTSGGRLREIVRQVAERHQKSDTDDSA